MSTRYASVHKWEDLAGPGDARPTALQIIHDENLTNKLSDKTFLVTGISTGIGVETLRALHATGAHVFGTVRNLPKGQKVVQEIVTSNPNGGKIDLIEMELSSLSSVRKGAEEVLQKSGGKLNILIANAGIMAVPEGKTVDGHESQFGTNHLSHFLLFQLLKRALLSSATPEFPSRVVSVSSIGHRGGCVRLDDLDFASGGYDKWLSYAQSKTANIWFANAIDRKFSSQHLRAVAVHPGGIYGTGIITSLNAGDMAPFQTPEAYRKSKDEAQGAATSVFAALGEEWRDVGGVWAADCQVEGPHDESKAFLDSMGYATWAFDREGEEKLWDMSFKLVGLEGE